MAEPPSGDERDELGAGRDEAAQARDSRSGQRDETARDRDALARAREDSAAQHSQASLDRLWEKEVSASATDHAPRVAAGPDDLERAYEQAVIDLEAAESEAEWARRELREVLEEARQVLQTGTRRRSTRRSPALSDAIVPSPRHL